jgi:hypothetical protein
MVAVLNKRWLSMGWRVMDKDDSEPMALVFLERLEGIPYQYFDELAKRAGNLRARRIEQGLKVDDFSADMMVACWPALRADIKEREIAAGRTLTGTAESQCPGCHGTGMERLFDAAGKHLGTRPGCKHEYAIDDERPTMDGFDMAEAAVKQSDRPETAIEICKRVRRHLAKDFIGAASEEEGAKAWAASKTWTHAEQYCRENPND